MTDERDLDPSVAAYDRDLVPWLFEHWAEPMVDLVAPTPQSRIVDLACGSGLIVRHLLDRLGAAGRVDGVDIDAAMLEYAAASVDDDRVAWHRSDAARLPFETSSMDRVSCHQGLQFFPERSAALAEVRRVLEPGGRLAVSTWGRLEDNPWPTALAHAVGQVLGEEVGADMKTVCALGEPGDLAELLGEAGFEDVVVGRHARTVSHVDVSAAAAGQLAALASCFTMDDRADEQRADLVGLMCELLADYTDATGRLDAPSTCIHASGVNP